MGRRKPIIIDPKKEKERIEKKTQKLYGNGWREDEYYVCIRAKKRGMTVYGMTLDNNDDIIWCPNCGEMIYEVQTHFHIGENFKVA